MYYLKEYVNAEAIKKKVFEDFFPFNFLGKGVFTF